MSAKEQQPPAEKPTEKVKHPIDRWREAKPEERAAMREADSEVKKHVSGVNNTH